MYDSSDDEYARRVANGGRGIPAFVSIPPPQAPSQPTTTGRFRFRPISTGGLPKGYKRKEKENAVAGPSRQPAHVPARTDEDGEPVPYVARERVPFPLSDSHILPEGPVAGPSHTSSPLKRPRDEERSTGPNKRTRNIDESVMAFSSLYLAFR